VIQFEDHKNYVSSPTGQGSVFIGGGADSAVGSGILNSESIKIINKNDTASDDFVVGALNSNFNVDPLSTWNQIRSFCKTYNSDYAGVTHTSDNLIFSPYFRKNHFYNLFAVTGRFVNRDNTTGNLRFVFCPDEPESWLISSGINSGSNMIHFPDMERSIIKKHFMLGEREQEDSDRWHSWLSGSGNYFDLTIGVNNDEYVNVSGISGDHFILKTGTNQSHQVANRIVSTNTLHPPPSGETGDAQEFQVRIANNNDGDSRFYIAGSGVTGGCHLGGTFTGSGYSFFETPVIDVYRGFSYFFNQHHASNHNNYIMFSYTSGGHREGGTAITGKYAVEKANSSFCFNNYCSFHCPDEQTFLIPIDASDKIYYYASGTSHVGGTGYLNVLTSGDGYR